jgi:hypothetical protein
MGRLKKSANSVKGTVQKYPASTSTPFIAVATQYAVDRGWIDVSMQWKIIAAWPAVITLIKEKILTRIFPPKVDE